MIETSQAGGPSHRSVEIGVTLAIMVFAAVDIVGSIEAGIDWGAEGPKAGFFPFYVGLLILVSSVVNLTQAWTAGSRPRLFAEWGQLAQVRSVVIPTAIYVALVPYIGIYVASAVLIAFFMRWFGCYPWSRVLAVSVGVPLLTFFIFEMWFLVPLPKGPIEEFLGF